MFSYPGCMSVKPDEILLAKQTMPLSFLQYSYCEMWKCQERGETNYFKLELGQKERKSYSGQLFRNQPNKITYMYI